MLAPIPFAPPVVLLALTLRSGGVDPRRLPLFAAMLLRTTLFEPLRLAEHAVHGRAVARHTLTEPPLFVLGHWRSGTSWLQALLARDPRFTTTTLFNTLFADVSGVSEPWLKPVLNRLAAGLGLPFSLQRMPLDLDLCGEGDVGLCCQQSPYAYTWGHVFPRRFDDWLRRCVLDPTPEHARAWLDHLDRYLRKLSRAAGGQRVVMKSPGDTGRVALLARRWPEARFVFVHRDPIDVFHSNVYLWQVIRREYSVQTVSDEVVQETILDTYEALLRCYLAQRDQVPAGQLVEVAYEALRADPAGELGRIYAELGLGQAPAISEPPRPARTWPTSPALEQRIRARWAFAFEAWRDER